MHLSIRDLAKELINVGVTPTIVHDPAKKSTKVAEIIKILKRDPTNAMKVCVEPNTFVPNHMKSVVVKNNSMVEGSWILTTKELEELFNHKDYFP
jgi:D-arabinose 1-dehydrogenase-like Zn-dependent alcohol dehydrogenase